MEYLPVELESSDVNRTTANFEVVSVTSEVVFMILMADIEDFEVLKDLLCVVQYCVGDCIMSGLLVSRSIFLRDLLGGNFLVFVMLSLYRTFKPLLDTNKSVRLSDKGWRIQVVDYQRRICVWGSIGRTTE